MAEDNASSGTSAATKGGGRGPKWSTAEDMELCKAWVATSEDATVGSNQKGSAFKAKFLLNYTKLLNDYNKNMGTKHSTRTATSCHNRFAKMSRFVLKYLSIEEQMGKPPTFTVFLFIVKDDNGDCCKG